MSIPPASKTERLQPLGRQKRFEFDDDMTPAEPRWVEVNVGGVRVDNLRQPGGPWLSPHLIRTLQLDTFLDKEIPEGRGHVPWDVTSLILIIARLLNPSSELHIAEQCFAKTALMPQHQKVIRLRNDSFCVAVVSDQRTKKASRSVSKRRSKRH